MTAGRCGVGAVSVGAGRFGAVLGLAGVGAGRFGAVPVLAGAVSGLAGRCSVGVDRGWPVSVGAVFILNGMIFSFLDEKRVFKGVI